jgi:hypothetical protein
MYIHKERKIENKRRNEKDFHTQLEKSGFHILFLCFPLTLSTACKSFFIVFKFFYFLFCNNFKLSLEG